MAICLAVGYLFASSKVQITFGQPTQTIEKKPTKVAQVGKKPGKGGFKFTPQWRDPNNPNVTILDKDWDVHYRRRDSSKDPKREPGPFSLQRYEHPFSQTAFPSVLGVPVALTPEDLKAGKVDVAIVGIPNQDNPSGGQAWAPNQMRVIRTIDYAHSGNDSYLNINYFEKLNVVDYGNASYNPLLAGQNNEEHAKVLGEILDAGATFIGIGGDHSTEASCLLAMYKKFGPKNFAIVHFDAHHDVYKGSMGAFVHGGRQRRWAYENGWLKGEDMISVGMRTPYGDPKILKWQQMVGERYHYMAEFDRDGFDTVFKRILKEVKGKRLYISFDMDAIDPAHVCGISNPEPGGFTSKQAITMLRGLAMQNDVAGIEFTEYSPLLDDNHYNTAIVMDRLMRAFLAGKAARKMGITDPHYVAPEMLNHGQRGK